MFTQLAQKDGINKSGCGLGLTICKNLTQKMGGDIKVESVYGKGTTFSFRIEAQLKMLSDRQ